MKYDAQGSENRMWGIGESTEQTVIIDRRQVQKITRISRSLIYELIREGKFPRQVQLSPNRVGWVADEIENWLRQKAQQRR